MKTLKNWHIVLTILIAMLAIGLTSKAAEINVEDDGSEKWTIEDVGYFYYPATGDGEGNSYAILSKKFVQSNEWLKLLEEATESAAKYAQRMSSNPTPTEEAKTIYRKMTKHALGGRAFKGVKQFEDGNFGIAIYDKKSETELWGVLDENGNTIVPCLYIDLIELGEGMYGVEVKKGGNSFWGAINRQGKIVIPTNYTVLVGEIWSHKYGHIILRDTKGKVGMMNFDGTIAIPFKYDGFGDEYDHVIVARIARNTHILIDKSGRRLTQNTYERIWGDNESVITGLRNGKQYHLSTEGKELGIMK